MFKRTLQGRYVRVATSQRVSLRSSTIRCRTAPSTIMIACSKSPNRGITRACSRTCCQRSPMFLAAPFHLCLPGQAFLTSRLVACLDHSATQRALAPIRTRQLREKPRKAVQERQERAQDRPSTCLHQQDTALLVSQSGSSTKIKRRHAYPSCHAQKDKSSI